MAEDRLASSLQTVVLATLAFDQRHGAAIAAQVRAVHFDALFRDFAARLLTYRTRYGKPPGRATLKDLADQVSYDGREDTVVHRRLIPLILAEADGLNGEYAATRVSDFIRRQTLKEAIVKASDRYGTDDERMVVEVEGILHEALTSRTTGLSAGTFLSDQRGLDFLNRDDTQLVSLAIPELDRLRIGLEPKKMLLYLAPKGTGKTWFCVHCGKQALFQRQRVIHVSLEMGEAEIVARYYQALFGAAESAERFNQSTLVIDKALLPDDKVLIPPAWSTKLVKPQLSFDDPGIRKTLLRRQRDWGTRFGALVVKAFPTGQLTVPELTGYLDYMESSYQFIPNLLLVDYPKLMHLDRGNLRLDLGRTVEELRGLAGKRNLAIVIPHQSTRESQSRRWVRSSMAGEDISVIQTADVVLAYSRTELESQRGLGRLSVEHTRRARSGASIVLAQSYDTGQYVTDSAPIQKAYWDRMRELGEDEE